jgi:ribonuclease HII
MFCAGIDECGCGALAGPIVACCVASETPATNTDELKAWWPIKGVTDSKKLSEAGRERLSKDIVSYLLDVGGELGIGLAESWEIDEYGHTAAWRLAMQRAVYQMGSSKKLERLIVDGNVPVGIAGAIELAYPKADKNFFHVAAASIIGKVHRDALMTKMDRLFPGYDLASSKGYPTGSHIWAVDYYGLSQQHRAKPCETVLRKWRQSSGGSASSRPPG